MSRILLPLTLLSALLLTASVVSAHRPLPPPVRRSLITVQLEDEGGRPLQTYHHQGQTFVLGEHGQRYAIRVHNHSPLRVEVVLAVDGRDAVSGQVTDGVRHRGYVIPGYGSVRVEGFRRSLSAVAAFRFTDPADSYSGRLGTPHRVGVIAVSAFPERAFENRPLTVPDWQRREWHGPPPAADKRPAAGTTSQTPPAPGPQPERSARAHAELDIVVPWPRQPQNNLGTQFGETRTSRVVEVDFQRERPGAPSQRVTIRYDDATGLAARGIEIFPRPWPEPRPVILEPAPPARFAPPPPPASRWD